MKFWGEHPELSCSPPRYCDSVLLGTCTSLSRKESMQWGSLSSSGKDKKGGEVIILKSRNIYFTCIGVLKYCFCRGWDKRNIENPKRLQDYNCFVPSGGTSLSSICTSLSICSGFTWLSLIVLFSCFTSGFLENLGFLSSKGRRLHSSATLIFVAQPSAPLAQSIGCF